MPEIVTSTGLSKATIYRLIADRQFPRQFSLGGQSVGWLESEVEAWMAERPRPSARATAPKPEPQAAEIV